MPAVRDTVAHFHAAVCAQRMGSTVKIDPIFIGSTVEVVHIHPYQEIGVLLNNRSTPEDLRRSAHHLGDHSALVVQLSYFHLSVCAELMNACVKTL
jgi:hypothetical protein